MYSFKKYFNIVGIVLTLLLYACADTNITPLNTTKVLEPEKIIEIPDACYNESFIYDSLLVLVASCDTTVYHVYNKNSLNFITSFGIKGKSPQEFNLPFFYRSNTTSTILQPVVDFYDINLAQKKKINFASIAKGVNPYECIESSVLEHELFNAYDLSCLENNKIAGRKIGESAGLFFIADMQSKKMDWVDYIPEMRISDSYKTRVYYGHLWSNEKNIMYASRHMDEVLFFNSDGELLKEHNFSKLEKPILSKKFSGVALESMLYFMSAYGTPGNCYVVRVGRTGEEFFKKFNSPSNMLVFDWNGNLKDVYQHRESFFSPFCVDATTNTMYCIIKSDDADNPNVKLQKIPL